MQLKISFYFGFQHATVFLLTLKMLVGLFVLTFCMLTSKPIIVTMYRGCPSRRIPSKVMNCACLVMAIDTWV